MNERNLALPKPIATFDRNDIEGIEALLNNDTLPLDTTFEVVSEEGTVLFMKHVHWGIALTSTEETPVGKVTTMFNSLYAERCEGDVITPMSVTIRDGAYWAGCRFFDGEIDITDIEVGKEVSEKVAMAIFGEIAEANPELQTEDPMPMLRKFAEEVGATSEGTAKVLATMVTSMEAGE